MVPIPEVEPEQAAVAWAQRNTWFGSDMDMTELAYQVHDRLVLEEGVLPSSPRYYKVRATAAELHLGSGLGQVRLG